TAAWVASEPDEELVTTYWRFGFTTHTLVGHRRLGNAGAIHPFSCADTQSSQNSQRSSSLAYRHVSKTSSIKYLSARCQNCNDLNRLGVRLAPTKSDRKSTRLNSSHVSISYAVFCLKKKNRTRP